MLTGSIAMYILCFIDRSNIVSRTKTQDFCLNALINYCKKGNAKVLNSDSGDSLVQTLKISNQQYLVALMIFIVAYTLFETPSNYMLKKFRPSRW